MNPYIFTVDEIIDIASPSTRNLAERALIANVGETEAAAMIGDDGKPDDDEPVVCRLCRKTAASIEDAIDLGWVPGYWTGNELPVDNLVCSECADARLTLHDGKFQLTGTADHEPPPF